MGVTRLVHTYPGEPEREIEDPVQELPEELEEALRCVDHNLFEGIGKTIRKHIKQPERESAQPDGSFGLRASENGVTAFLGEGHITASWETVAEWRSKWQPEREAGSGRQPIETAPKGVPVLVAGGIAMQKTGGEWFTGMEEPRYERQLQWQPKWWMPIPADND